jgi:hypothetical protein
VHPVMPRTNQGECNEDAIGGLPGLRCVGGIVSETRTVTEAKTINQ